MADLLASLGIVSGPPDPKKLENQKEVAQQTNEVKDQIKGLLGSLGIVSQTAKLAGINTASIDALQKQADELVKNTTLSPDQLEKKRAELEKKFEIEKAEQEEAAKKAIEAKLQDALKAIEDRTTSAISDGGTSEGLRKRFEILLEDAKYSLKTFQDALVTPPTTPPVPTPKTSEALMDELEILNLDKEKEEDSTFNLGRLVKRSLLQVKTYFFYILFGFGLLIGGSFCSNMYALEKFIGIRLYYYIYGALLFPLVILWSIFSPPYLHSIVAPILEVPSINPDNRLDSLFSFERVTADQQELKLGSSKTTARVTAIAYTSVVGAYVLVFYGIDFVRDRLAASGLF